MASVLDLPDDAENNSSADETPGELEFDGYRPTTPDEIAFVRELNKRGSDTMNHFFTLPTVGFRERLCPLHWAIYLDIPDLVHRIAAYTCVHLKVKIKGGLDPIDAYFVRNRVRCFQELIPFFTAQGRALITRALAQSNTAFLEAILTTIDPGCSNEELLALSRRASLPHRGIVQRFVEAHPGSQRDRETLKCRTQTRGLPSYAPRTHFRRDSDDDVWLDDDDDILRYDYDDDRGSFSDLWIDFWVSRMSEFE